MKPPMPLMAYEVAELSAHRRRIARIVLWGRLRLAALGAAAIVLIVVADHGARH